MSSEAGTLILGWGNSGRADDGLGPEVVRVLTELGLPGVEAQASYQLQIEDATEVARHQRVVFIDAARSGAEPFSIDRLSPQEGGWTFSTHSISPATVLAMARDLFGAEPEAWLLGVRGYEFDEFREQLSDRARANLQQVVSYLESALRGGGLREIRPRQAMTAIANQHEGDPCQTTNP
jgi:hydrogenase maturation protease